MQEILAKLKETQANPGFYKHLTPEEQAELFVFLLQPKKLFQKPTTIQGEPGKDAKPLVKDVDYQSKEASLKFLDDIQKTVEKRLQAIPKPTNGKDAEVTPELIEEIVTLVAASIEIPEIIPFNDSSLKESIELALLDHEELRDEVERLKKVPTRVIGGGAQINWVKKYVNAQIDAIPGSTTTWDYYATNWSVAPSVNTTITGGTVYNYTLDGTTRYRFVPTTYDPTQDAFYSTFSGGTLSGLIVARG